MIDIAALLGAEWKIDDQVKVTSENQLSLSTDLPDACGLKLKATSVPSVYGGYPSYAPPIGWTVYYVSRPAGAGTDELNIQDALWVDPSGMAWSVNNCMSGVTSGSDEQLNLVSDSQGSQGSNHLWILLAAVAGLAYFTFKD